MQNHLDFSMSSLNFSGEHVREMEKFNKYEAKDCEAHYDEVAKYYEAIYTRVGFPDPTKCAEWAARCVQSECIPPEESQVLDFGCGTGLCGQELTKFNFQNIHGIDIS